MRIVFVTPSFLPKLGGVETHVLELGKELSMRGHSVQVVTVGVDPKLPLHENIAGIAVHRRAVGDLRNKKAIWQAMYELREVFTNADVVHVHDVWWWLVPIYPLVARKLFTTFHGWEGNYPVAFGAKLHRWVAALGSVRTMHVGDWIREFYWDVPDAVAYGGVSSMGAPYKRLQKAGKRLALVFLGRLSQENDIEKYVELLDLMKVHNVSYAMTWVGDGPMRDRCAEYGKVTGMVTNPTTYLAAGAIVFASSYLSMLIAQASGAIVCALYSHQLKQRYLKTFPGSAHTIVGSNVAEVWARIDALQYDSQARQTLCSQAASFARTQTWQKVADRYLLLWK